MKLLLKRSANIDAPEATVYMRTALNTTNPLNGHASVIKLPLDKDANIKDTRNVNRENHFTVPHTYFDYTERIKPLLEKGVNIDATRGGMGIALNTVSGSHVDVLKLLLEKGKLPGSQKL